MKTAPPRKAPNPWLVAAELIDPVRYDEDPVRWADDKADRFLWSGQAQIIESVRDHPQTAVKSCHTIGKSFTAATASGWWIDAHPAGEAFVVTSAPTGPQVKAILWREINRLHKQAGLAGHTNLTEWYNDGELVAFGRKPNDYEPTAFQGIHAKFVLVVLDEACGIPKALWDAAMSLVSNEHNRVLAIGNPDDETSHFHTVCQPDSGWNVITIAAQDTPTFTGEKVPAAVAEVLISKEWVERRKLDWGEDSPVYQSKVLAEFPSEGPNVVVPGRLVAQARTVEFPDVAPRVGGLDVGAGGDKSILAWRAGRRLESMQSWNTRDPIELVDLAAEHIRLLKLDELRVDVIGWGWGIYGSLRALANDGRLGTCQIVTPVNVAERAHDADQFINRRAELWWMAREALRSGDWDLCSLDDDAAAELSAPRYKITKDRIQVEAKDDIRKRLGRSTDKADAILMAYAIEISRGYTQSVAGVDLGLGVR